MNGDGGGSGRVVVIMMNVSGGVAGNSNINSNRTNQRL